MSLGAYQFFHAKKKHEPLLIMALLIWQIRRQNNELSEVLDRSFRTERLVSTNYNCLGLRYEAAILLGF